MKLHPISIPGITVQFPWADLILSGQKVIETRFYPLPPKWIGKPLAIIETPGLRGSFKRRVAGIAVLGESFPYANRMAFDLDHKKHLVDSFDPIFGWKSNLGPKWGWPILWVVRHQEQLPGAFRTGMRYSSAVPLFKLPASLREVLSTSEFHIRGPRGQRRKPLQPWP
jgi:hypothetical protein